MRTRDWLWLLGWAVASSVWCCTASAQLGATFDEPLYVARGLEGWRGGSHQGLMQLGTMPLPIDVQTLPLYLWERWHVVLFDPVADLPRLLPWARAGTLLFWWLLLFYGDLLGRELGGPWGGRLAVAMLACEPCLLAHAALATTDIAITACLLALVYHFRKSRESGWLLRIGVPAFWFGAAVLAKASGLMFGPLCLLVVELERLLRKQPHRDSASDPATEAPVPLRSRIRHLVHTFWTTSRHDFVQIGVLGLVVAVVYCGSDWKPQPSFVAWAHQLSDNAGGRALAWVADHLCIFTNAGEGLVRQIRHNVRGHGVYILGSCADRAVWYYFPVALSIKLSLPLLILPLVLFVVQPRALLNAAFLAALALLLFSVTFRVQIGIRLVLPLIALAITGMAAAAAQVCWLTGTERTHEEGRSPAAVGRLAVLAGVCWTALAAILVWPEGLCYTNELWGGTTKGYIALSDSNYDWGQGLKELADWQHRHPARPLAVWYFGTDPSIRTLPVREARLQDLEIAQAEDLDARVRGHYLAVSTTVLYGSLATVLSPGSSEARSYRVACALLRQRQPVDRTSTFMIYDFTDK
jgi:hypothetical protein